MTSRTAGWDGYIDWFHDERAGITEALLGRSVDETGRTAYEWAGESTAGGVVLDVGCGSGPMHPLVAGWVGVDRSAGELDRARSQGRGPLVMASATDLPIADRSVSDVLAVMSLMVVDEPRAVLAEIWRVLEPGGRLVLLLPGARPLTVRDRVRYGALLLALGRMTLPVPHPEVSGDPTGLLTAVGFEVVSDERRRSAYPLFDENDAATFLDGMYTPGLSERRRRRARAVVARWPSGEIGLPLRRVVARKPA